MHLEQELEFSPIPDYGVHVTLQEFVNMISNGEVTDDDGSGYWATAQLCSNKRVYFETQQIPDFATHIVWFNK